MLTLLLGLLSTLPLQGQQPVLKSGVEVVAIDAHVVHRTGTPVTDLRPEEVDVRISGRSRRVISLELVSYTDPAPVAPGASRGTETGSAASPRPRRMFILAVDEHSLHASNAMAAVTAAERFIDRLQPDDLIAVYAYPTGTAQHDLTTDHGAVRRALRNITGCSKNPTAGFTCRRRRSSTSRAGIPRPCGASRNGNARVEGARWRFVRKPSASRSRWRCA